MEATVQMLKENPDILQKVREGTVRLFNLSKQEEDVIVKVMSRREMPKEKMDYWM